MLIPKLKNTILIGGQSIEKTQHLDSIFYRIPFSHIRIGRASFSFKQVENYDICKYYKTNNIYEECLRRGLKKTDIVTNLRIFYPNGNYRNDKDELYMRQGFGSLVLEEIIKDSLKKSSKLIHTNVTTEYMEKFCVKKNFEQSREFEKSYFLLINF